ncbi:hypothetical protein GCM10010123_01460 [Pilimelia anulata]|uniref:TnsA endonuclease N-terminal domain-containing protein n=1 Tax=Pilimelia anulata TaxID=53371 RepID=A0A8J3AZM8_9ACTN|nr:TnsA-like heteromeric transposase endonuclease subunit [Pilimelia anulata]GGJ75192.1 hypothetical protein GCM10010123_01460 [Pilimelia anulata]
MGYWSNVVVVMAVVGERGASGAAGGLRSGVLEAVVRVRDARAVVRELPAGEVRAAFFAGCVPWRRARSRRGQRHLPGEYWSATTGGHVPYESQLELDRLLMADFDRDVVDVVAQPCEVTAVVDGRRRRHVPDFLLVTAAGLATVVNVKPAERLAKSLVAQALEWPRQVFTAAGFGYEIWSGCDLVRLENVRFLAGYRRPWIADDDALRRVRRAVGEGASLDAVERALAAGGQGWSVRPLVLAALWRHQVLTDLGRPLSGASVLRRSV